MARLARPYIPLSIRVQVAERQFCQHFPAGMLLSFEAIRNQHGVPHTLANRLRCALEAIFPDGSAQLDHDPALVNRPFNKRTGKYTPDANDPEFLIYRTKVDHDIKTRIRGTGALRSDLSQARYLKKVARNRETRPKASRFPKQPSRVKRATDSAAKLRRPKQKWPARPFPRRAKP